jgi:host factor-I protein
MLEKIINIQDAFLNYVRKNKVPVTIFLLNGVKLNGIISCFDKCSVVIKKEGYTQLIYKHAISTFSPHGAINLFEWNGSSNPQQKSTESQELEEDRFEEDYEDDDE